MLWLCDIRLPAAGRGVRRARALVDALGPDVPGELRDDLRLLISEVATNAVRHGGVGDAGDATIRVRLGVELRSVRVEIHDRGPGFQPAPRGPRAELDSGWGVHLVETLASRWGTGRDASGAWVVWFELRLPEPHDAGAAFGPRAGEGAPLGRGAQPGGGGRAGAGGGYPGRGGAHPGWFGAHAGLAGAG